MKKVPHYIMRIASRALAMMDGNILRKWKSCWMQACTAGSVLLIAPPAFAALSVSIACNDFELTGTSSCNYFLDGTAAELADIERVEVSAKIPSRVGKSWSPITRIHIAYWTTPSRGQAHILPLMRPARCR